MLQSICVDNISFTVSSSLEGKLQRKIALLINTNEGTMKSGTVHEIFSHGQISYYTPSQRATTKSTKASPNFCVFISFARMIAILPGQPKPCEGIWVVSWVADETLDGTIVCR